MGYVKKRPKEDTRSVFGRRVDQLCGLLLLWLASYLLLASLTGRPAASLLISVPLLGLEAVMLRKYFSVIYRKRQERQRYRQAGDKLLADVLKMDSRNEFKLFVRDILARLPGFQVVRIKKAKNKENGPEEQDIDLEFTYQDIPLAVTCMRPEKEQKITTSQIRSFAAVLHRQGYKNGLLVTTGDSLPSVVRVIRAYSRRGVHIRIVNRYGLINLALRAGVGADRAEEDAPVISPLPAGEKRAAVINVLWDTIFSYGKAKHYFLFGLLLYGGYILVRGTYFLSLFYLSFALLNILLGIACLYLGRSAGEADPLKKLHPGKR